MIGERGRDEAGRGDTTMKGEGGMKQGGVTLPRKERERERERGRKGGVTLYHDRRERERGRKGGREREREKRERERGHTSMEKYPLST